MNNEPVDIVIPWLNPTEKWYEEYKKYNDTELSCRIRDLNTIRPAIKSILKNLPWIRYIWLIVFDEEQHCNLNWEELKNDKVKFVYHHDIIPQEFLPNFNSMIVECFAHKIEGLAENFIWSNDDMIFTKFVPKEFYFDNNLPVHRYKTLKNYIPVYNCQYDYIINTSSNFIKKITGQNVLTSDFHMPVALKKAMFEFLWFKYKDELYNSCLNSKVRKNHNLALANIIITLDEFFNHCIYNDLHIKTQMIVLTDNTSKTYLNEAIKNNHIVCFNDGELLVKNDKIIAEYIKELL